ncbi:hypothetical protein MNBD_GAMMA26-1819 [hydrothermal vent metagenome]|uniref:Lipoprotein n=1 Tax=hydrothermal vent metagenome TaxID=652676 RepID=A0A3B1BK55_9ZZZZ
MIIFKSAAMKKKPIPLIILILLVLLTSGCTNFGPNRLQASRNDYNVAIQQTGDEQLLLNLVRLQYRDTPLFLEESNEDSHHSNHEQPIEIANVILYSNDGCPRF